MKTSTKIIIAFVLLIVSSMLILFVDSRNHQVKNVEKEYDLLESALSPFTVVVASDGSDVNVDQADSSKIGIEIPKGEKISAKLYSLSNDTLYIYCKYKTWVKCKNINRIISQNPTWLVINYFNTDSLQLDITGGRTYMNDISSKININHLVVNATGEAYIELFEINTKSIDVNLTNFSRLKLAGIHNRVTANIKNNSELYVPPTSQFDLTLKKDSTSRIFGYN